MNQLRAWLYGRDVQNRWPQEDSSLMSVKETGSVEGNVTSDNVNKNLVNGEEIVDSYFKHLLLKVVPLQPGDCLGCKLVGTTVMVASGVIVLTSAMVGKARNPDLFGRKLLIYKAVCGSLFVGFEMAAVCRFFDLGPFSQIAQWQRQKME